MSEEIDNFTQEKSLYKISNATACSIYKAFINVDASVFNFLLGSYTQIINYFF